MKGFQITNKKTADLRLNLHEFVLSKIKLFFTFFTIYAAVWKSQIIIYFHLKKGAGKKVIFIEVTQMRSCTEILYLKKFVPTNIVINFMSIEEGIMSFLEYQLHRIAIGNTYIP